MEQEQEIWVPIKDYEGLYEISSFGRVKSMLKYKGKGGNILVPEKILKAFLNPIGKGYYQIDLLKKGVRKTIKVHRIVAINFIENPLNLKEIKWEFS